MALSITNKKIRENNIGGIWYALFMPMRLIQSIPTWTSGYISIDSVLPMPGAPWFRIDFTMDTAVLKQKTSRSGEGVKYTIDLEGQVAKDYVDRYEQWRDKENDEFAIVVVYNNRLAVLLGYIDIHGTKKGAHFDFDFTSGKKKDDFNAYDIKFTITQSFPMRPAYLNSLTVDNSIPDPGTPITFGASVTALGGGPPPTD